MLLGTFFYFKINSLQVLITTFIDPYYYVYRPLLLRLSTLITTFIDLLTTDIFKCSITTKF